MVKHFENLWEESEEIISEFVKTNNEFNLKELIPQIVNDLLTLPSSAERHKALGTLLLYITFYTKSYDINAYQALQESIDSLKLELYDPD